MGNETIQDTSFFNDKREKQGKNWKNRGKITKKQEKTGKNRKLQEIQKHHLDEVPENGNEFSARFREMLKTKRKRCLPECHETTIREQKRCIVPTLGPGEQQGAAQEGVPVPKVVEEPNSLVAGISGHLICQTDQSITCSVPSHLSIPAWMTRSKSASCL